MTCPKGHLSTDPDYCSECGAKMANAPTGLAVNPLPTPADTAAGQRGEVCPDCGTLRADRTARFCEICRYNFETRESWSAASVAAPFPTNAAPTDAPASSTPAVVAPPTAAVNAAVPTDAIAMPSLPAEAALLRWEVIVRVDPSLYTDPEPNIPCPLNEPERTFPLDFAENLLGRRSDRQDIHPEIALSDPGVSRRHAKLLRQADGTFVLLDVGSSNGTQLNGVDIQAGVRTPITDGDEITLGCWTRLTVRAMRQTP